jgi:hypothetical protein
MSQRFQHVHLMDDTSTVANHWHSIVMTTSWQNASSMPQSLPISCCSKRFTATSVPRHAPLYTCHNMRRQATGTGGAMAAPSTSPKPPLPMHLPILKSLQSILQLLSL